MSVRLMWGVLCAAGCLLGGCVGRAGAQEEPPGHVAEGMEADGGQPAQCPHEDPHRRYVSRDPGQCAAIRFYCDPGYQPFFDDCGCGCEPAP